MFSNAVIVLLRLYQNQRHKYNICTITCVVLCSVNSEQIFGNYTKAALLLPFILTDKQSWHSPQDTFSWVDKSFEILKF